MDNKHQDLSKTLQLLRDGLHHTIQSFRVYRVDDDNKKPFLKPDESQKSEPASLQEEQLVNLNESYFETAQHSSKTLKTNSDSSSSSEKIVTNKGRLNLHDVISEAITKREKRKKKTFSSLEILKENSRMSVHASERNVYFINESQTDGFEILSKPSILNSDMSNFVSSEKFLVAQDIETTSVTKEESKLEINEKMYDPDQDEPDDIINDTSTYFKDGFRKVDYILVYNKNNSAKMEAFLNNICKDGLDVEVEESKIFKHLMFVKIHAPKSFLSKMELRLHIKWSFRNPHYFEQKSTISFTNTILTLARGSDKISERAPQLMQTTTVTDAERIMAVHKLLTETKFGKHLYDFGLEKMVESKILVCAFPMHDKMWEWINAGMLSDRQLLGKYWANFNCLIKVQPKQLINKYFGNEIAFYFAWLGFYTKMLLPAVVFGLMVLLYGLLTRDSHTTNKQSYEILKSNIILCPRCPRKCYYSVLRDSYQMSKFNYVLDNGATTIFNILMSFWGVIFLILWKQKENFLKIVWNLSNVNVTDTNKRANYYIVKRRKRFSALVDIEKYKNRQSNWWYLFSIAIIVLSSLVIINIIFGLIIIKMEMIQLYGLPNFFKFIQKIHYDKVKVHFMWSVITVVFIMIIDSITPIITYWLTKCENSRTESEFEKSYIIKLFVLTSISNYSIPLYLAFFRGIYYFPPRTMTGSKYPNLRHEVCDPSGCVFALACWLTTIIGIKLVKTLIVDSVVPRMIISFKSLSSLFNFPTEWEKNYTLLPYRKRQLIQLYIENIIQYGFVVCFVSACPLTPFLVWISNAIKLRLYAIKLIRYEKRPTPIVMTDLGIWNKILAIVTYIGIVIHIFVIAFTTEVIPKFLFFTENLKFENYIQSKLTNFHYTDGFGSNGTIKFCEFPAYRNSSSLDYSPSYFKIVGGKLIFTTVMEHLVLLFLLSFTYYIPAISASMKNYFNEQNRP